MHKSDPHSARIRIFFTFFHKIDIKFVLAIKNWPRNKKFSTFERKTFSSTFSPGVPPMDFFKTKSMGGTSGENFEKNILIFFLTEMYRVIS